MFERCTFISLANFYLTQTLLIHNQMKEMLIAALNHQKKIHKTIIAVWVTFRASVDGAQMVID